ncbi:MAG: HAMP domain-containing sensor histidine kinase [Candidatus Moranbacteria bacterium]|nr:HAMP domain-containing sensor histidine kinase [Candidatus Moranbacteria bacterium]
MAAQINSRFIRRLEAVSKAFAAGVFFIGLLAIIGWQFDVLVLKKVLPSLPVIAPNTAFSFTLIGLTLFLLLNEKTGERLRYFLFIFSSVVALVGFLTLIEYIFGLNFGIDNLFFARKMGASIVRMSPQSAFNFLAVGISLFFFLRNTKKGMLIGQIVIVAAGLISLLSLLGFIYNLSSLYTISPYKGMAAHTAVAFIMIFVSILALRPEIGLVKIFCGNGLSGHAARRLFVAMIFLVIIETLVMIVRRIEIYDYAYESLFHLLVVAGVFVYLIFVAFRSLDQLAEVERDIAHVRQIDKAKTEFVSLASHQLRTPLTSVSWYTEMLLNKDVGSLNEKQKEYLSEIYIGNRRMINLVDDILNTSRIDMGTLLIETKIISLSEIAKSVLDEMAPLLQDKKMEVKKYFEANLPKIKADPELIRIVIQNLCLNSLKYTPPGGSIGIGMKKHNSHVLMEVSDSGYGIPEKQKKRIFTKMFRADNIRSKETDGTGLGLYIVRAIVEQHGGRVWFESEENKGTTFYVSLPASTRVDARRAIQLENKKRKEKR